MSDKDNAKTVPKPHTKTPQGNIWGNYLQGGF